MLALRLLAKASRLPDDCLKGIDCRVGTKEQARDDLEAAFRRLEREAKETGHKLKARMF